MTFNLKQSSNQFFIHNMKRWSVTIKCFTTFMTKFVVLFCLSWWNNKLIFLVFFFSSSLSFLFRSLSPLAATCHFFFLLICNLHLLSSKKFSSKTVFILWKCLHALCAHSGPVVFHHLIHLQTESFPDFLQMCSSLRFLTAQDCDISALALQLFCWQIWIYTCTLWLCVLCVVTQVDAVKKLQILSLILYRFVVTAFLVNC